MKDKHRFSAQRRKNTAEAFYKLCCFLTSNKAAQQHIATLDIMQILSSLALVELEDLLDLH